MRHLLHLATNDHSKFNWFFICLFFVIEMQSFVKWVVFLAVSPLFDKQERQAGDFKRYNECIQHESLRVAVCDMLEGKLKCPSALRWVFNNS